MVYVYTIQGVAATPNQYKRDDREHQKINFILSKSYDTYTWMGHKNSNNSDYLLIRNRILKLIVY